MSTSNDGGSAFPQAGPVGSTGGMTLRDYFAAQILPKVFEMSVDGKLNGPNGAPTQFDMAKAAFALAGAMIAARDEPKPAPQQQPSDGDS